MPGELLSRGHECDTPPIAELKAGAVWRCDKGHFWLLVKKPISHEYVWRQMSALEAAFNGYGRTRADD